MKSSFADEADARVRNAQRAEEETLNAILDGFNQAFWTVDRAWRITRFNQAAEAFYGHGREEVIGRVLWDAFPSLPNSEFARRYKLAMAERSVQEFRIQSGTRPGRWLNVRAFAIPEGGLAVCWHDITSEYKAEQAAFDTGAHLKAAFYQAAAGFAEFDLDGRFIRVNDRYCALVGRSRCQLLEELRAQDLTHPEDRQEDQRLLARARASGESFETEKRYVRPDGRVVWVTNSVTGIRNREGDIQSFLAVAVDVSERREADDALQRNASRLRLALEAGRMAVWEFDASSGEVSGSPELWRLLGFPEGAAPDMAELRSRLVPGELQRLKSTALTARKRGDRLFELEIRCIWSDGSIRWLMLRAEAQTRSDGQPTDRYVGVMFDIDSRKKVEEALRLSEERMIMAQEAASIGTYHWDVLTGQLEWSRHMLELYGFDPDAPPDNIYEAWLKTLHPADRERAHQQTRAFLDDPAPVEIHFRIIRDGEVRWIQGKGRVERDKAGRPLRMVGVNIDVTNRMRVDKMLRDREAALRQSEQRLRATYEHAFVGIAEVDGAERFVRVNEELTRITGFSREELLGQPFTLLTHPADHARAHKKFMLQMAGDLDIYTLEKRYIHKDGHIIWVELSASRVDGPDGRPAYGIRVIRDISERKRAERHQNLLINELNHRVKNTLAMVQAISSQTLRNGGVRSEIREGFEGRLMALANAHDVLTRTNWDNADLLDVTQDALAPHQVEGTSRFTIAGPRLTIRPKTALALSLGLHELATNAMKYGALSQSKGRVNISWRVVSRTEGERFVFTWEERGGPPVLRPASRGFGSRMIERGLAAELDGEVRIDFDPKGVTCTIDAPYDAVQASNPEGLDGNE